jgi:hypothetical protein
MFEWLDGSVKNGRQEDQACPEYSRVLADADEEARCRTTPNTVMQRLAALRFLYSQVFMRGLSAA